MKIIMPVTKGNTIAVLLNGIRIAEEFHAPKCVVKRLEGDLVYELVLALLNNQNKTNN